MSKTGVFDPQIAVAISPLHNRSLQREPVLEITSETAIFNNYPRIIMNRQVSV
jgi:hypothetical protein